MPEHNELPASRGRGFSRRSAASLATLALITGSLVAVGGAGAANADEVLPVAGAQTAGDTLFPNQGNGGYDALHYDINLTVDVAISATSGAVATTTFPTATTTVLAATTGAPLSSYSFDFQGSSGNLAASTLNVNSVTVNGVPATFARIENTTTSSAVTDNHKLIVTPATPVSGEFTTVVSYSGTPVRHADTDGSSEGWNATTDGATFLNQPIGAMTAFPNNNTPRDKATYTITVNAPSKLGTSTAGNTGLRDAAVVSNGELVSQTPSTDGSRTTWVWNQAKPMASELSLISVGRYDVYHSTITLASGRTIPEWTFIDPAIALSSQTTTLSTRAQLKSIIDFFESKYGPYPGNSTGLVTDIVPSAINYALETQDRSFFPTSASRGTTYHEVMHQWFGDNVTPTDWNDIWLNEGPATYSEYQMPFEGAGSSTTTTEQGIYNLWNTTASTNAIFAVPVAAMTQASQLFGTPTYQKGVMTLEALRTSIGAANFAQLMHDWQVNYGGTSKRTSDFIALAQSISGRDLTAFFQTWVYTTGKPAWPVKYNVTLTGPTAPVAVGDTATYTLSTRNTGKVAMPLGTVVTVDVTGVLDKATLGTLPAGVTLSGNTLTWAVPATALAATSTVSFTAVPNVDTTGLSLVATAAASTLGSTCIDCTSTLVIGSQPVSPSAVPTISAGTPTVGTTLTADPGTWLDGTTFSYQWLLDGTPIVGANAATYTPDATVIGLALSVKVTGTNGSLTPVTKTSAATAVGVRAAFTSAPVPTISGAAQLGSKLTVDPGAWDVGTVLTYQWAANGTNISGATGPIYAPAVATQLGQVITVSVTGTKYGYTTTTKTSAATAALTAGVWVNSGATPTIAGTGRALSALAAQPGVWDDATVFSYVWSSNGSAISGATAATYTPPVTLIGTSVTLTVTGSKPGYPAVAAATSAPLLITAAAQVLSPTPTITGQVKVDKTLTAVPGTWDTGTTLSYQWFADGDAISGATTSTLSLGADKFGKQISVTVTSTRTNYVTTSKTSILTAAVSAGDLVATPVPVISTADAQYGVELTADAGTWDADTTLAYQWLADGTPIAGATSTAFTPGGEQVGQVLTVSVTGTKTAYLTVTKTSAATTAVQPGHFVDTPVPTIGGTPKVGELLTATAGTWDADTTLAYQWFADAVAIEGAITSEFTPGTTRVGAVITVAVTGTKLGIVTVTKTSDESDPVAPADLVTTPVPTITGTPRVDVLLTALPGDWDADTTLAYQWFADGDAITGATATEFVPTADEFGAVITVEVTGSKLGYGTVTKSSEPTAAVASGDLVEAPVPSISGTPQVAELLTATAGTWDSGTDLTYQWFADGDALDGATASTLTPSGTELGAAITVAVTGTKYGYTTVTQTSGVTAPVAVATLASTPKPTISGTPKVGVTLTAITGTWDAATDLSYAWYLDNVLVAGETGAGYTPVASTIGKVVTVSVTGTKLGYVTVTKTSDATAPIAIGTLALTPTPTITGTPQVGLPLTANAGTWDSGTALAYRWYADGDQVSGATASTYTPTSDDLGKDIVVSVRGTKTGYSAVLQFSASTALVTVGSLTSTPTPTVTGLAKVGAPLTAVPGTWDAGTTFTYQWSLGGAALPGETGVTYTPSAARLGDAVTVTVTGAKVGYVSSSQTSAASAAIGEGDLTSTPVPTILGTPKVNASLAVVPGTWDAGTVKTYQWSVDGVAVAGATFSSYQPGTTRAGTRITVTVTGTKAGYTPVSKTSAASAPVLPADLLFTPVPTITGTAKVGVQLTAVPGTWDAGATLAYQWYADGVAVAGATATKFTPAATAVGARITVKVTASKTGYASVSRTSVASAAVVLGSLTLTPVPTITGTPKVNAILSVVPGTWDAGTTRTYQWYVNGVAVVGATFSSYIPGTTRVGTRITVAVTASKPGYVSVTKTSAATAPVVR